MTFRELPVQPEGIIMIRAENIIAPAGRIISQGVSVRDTSAWQSGKALEPGDGAGGGGAGGSVMIQAERIIGPLTVNVRGEMVETWVRSISPQGPVEAVVVAWCF